MERLKHILKLNVVAVAAASAAALLLWQAVPAPPAQAARAETLPISTPASFADVIESVQPAVVNISSAAPAGSGAVPRSPSMEEFFRRFFGGQSAPTPQGVQPEVRSMGSGFIVEAQGLVVTNNHVIDGAHEIIVTLNNGDQYPAEVVGRDQKTDLALLQIKVDEELPFATFGDSDSTRAGDWVIAIGNPFGLGGTATTGIVSARGRDIRSGPFDDFLQIDAPINRGNSGGPLFDTQGRVIGVNTAIYSPNGGNVGIGFAIPASQAMPIIEQLKSAGFVERGWLGVQIQEVDDDMAQALGLAEAGGALVASVVGDSPADRSGLEPGDVILEFQDEEIQDIKDLTRLVASVPPHSEVDLKVWRNEKRKRVTVDLGQNPEDRAQQANLGTGRGGDSMAALGLGLQALTTQSRQRLGVDPDVDGALIVEVQPGSPAGKKGLRPGDVILQVGREKISDPAQVADEVARLKDEEKPSVVFQVARGDELRFLAVPLA